MRPDGPSAVRNPGLADVTELQRSHDRYQALTSASGAIVWTNDRDGKMQGPQADWCAYTGQSEAEVQGYGWSRAVHPDDAQPTIDAWQRSVAARSTFDFEHRVRGHDGVYRWFSVRAAPVIEADGTIREWVGVHRNIEEFKRTEQQREEAAARAVESERQFRTIVEAMPKSQLAWWARPDGFIDYYNPRWYEYTGRSPDDMMGWGWQSVHDPELLPSVMSQYQRSIATGEPFEMEFPLRRYDGVFRWFLTRMTPARDETGTIVRWIGINTDIHDQKAALAQLSETLEAMSDGFCLLDRNWQVVRVNGAYENIARVPRGESVGRDFWELFPYAKDPSLKWWAAYHRAMADRVRVQVEEYDAPLDVWTSTDVFPTPDGGIALIFRDTTQRKRLDEAREAARKEAENASRTKDEFLAMLGHELRNPLAPIQTALQLMRLRGSRELESERAVIERQVKHMVRLVDDLLDISRITRGKVELSRANLDVADVAARALEIARPLFEQRRQTLAVEVTRGLVVHGDPDRLAQVISNLLTNAAAYTPAGGRITISGDRSGNEVVLRVSDSGVGIAADLLPRVFDMFVQGQQGIDRAQGGLGLGLAIVRRLVELHGGRVTVHSDGLDRGSSFAVHLPAVEGVPVVAEDIAPSMPTELVSGEVRILVVDDNEDGAMALAEALRLLGYATRVEHDAHAALASLDAFKPQIALLDIGLPVMDGYELARRLRERVDLAPLRLVAITGYGQANDRLRTREAGFDDHLVKPVDLDDLAAVLRKSPAPSGE